jgi:hypothetical protein
VDKQGLTKQEHPPETVMVAGVALSAADAQQLDQKLAHFRSLSFKEQWDYEDQSERSDALRAAEMALYEAETVEYVRSGQADADARAYREAQFDQRMRAAKGVRRTRARARGAGRPAGRRVARQSSSSDDGSDDPDESDALGAQLVAARRWAA